ncbi:hypothetical protein Taro_000266 [Colocasia esculenta]|uniref:non-specific serine/threonine protein kinase n=1 Tax=Colocasia esculenta TaxID=4460 RepID=A0A843TG40_COLES|nr:hypothetical protein [Colocasia esculenta]
MKCFGFFKDKSGSRPAGQKSVPATKSVSVNGTGTSRVRDSSSTKAKTQPLPSAPSSRGITALYEEKAHRLRVFDFSELRNATNDFNKMLKIGEGGFGSVYRGIIKPSDPHSERVAVAIKKLKQGGRQGHKQWLAEVQFLGIVNHPNLVKLFGYCSLDNDWGIQRLLVYEYLPNKTLEHHLFNRAYPALAWDTRLKIAISVAEGLRYLHEGLEVQVIYRDFKASNVLLDKDFNPKLSDFGLAREGPSDGRTHVTTVVVGTYGYACPDYVATGHLTIKSDVWSFGVVLLEILTGRRCLDRNRPGPEQKLLEWVKQFPVESGSFSMIMDPRLRNNFSVSAARSIAKVANTCLTKNRKQRPSMGEVVERLKLAIGSCS